MNNDWRGYTLDELRYRQAAVLARNDAARITARAEFAALRNGNPITRSWHTMRDVFSAIGYVNSLVLGFQLFRRVRGVWRMFRS